MRLDENKDTRNQLRIVEDFKDKQADLKKNPTRLKFRIATTSAGDFEDIMTHAKVLNTH